MSLIKYLTGAKSGYNPTLLVWTAALVIPVISFFTTVLLCYFKKDRHEELTRGHIFVCLVLWVIAKILLIPSQTFDVAFHHVWKVTASSQPISALYETKCFALDYPPLFAYFEKFWGSILSWFAHPDFTLSRVFNESLSFLVLMRLTVIATDFVYFFSLLALFRFAQNYRPSNTLSSHRVAYNVGTFGFCLFDGALLAIDNGSFQYNSIIFALIIWSIIFLLSKRELLAAFLYCVAVLTKQITIYYSVAYLGYFLFNYVLSFTKSSFRIHWLRLLKLGVIVCGSVFCAFYPLRDNLPKVFHQLTGGDNDPVGYAAIPTLQFVYAFTKVGFFVRL